MYQKVYFCPACTGKLLKQNNRHGQTFWFCEKRPVCRLTLSDTDGVPDMPEVVYPCPECKAGILLERVGHQKRMFWACSQYPDCSSTYNDLSGKPKGVAPPQAITVTD